LLPSAPRRPSFIGSAIAATSPCRVPFGFHFSTRVTDRCPAVADSSRAPLGIEFSFSCARFLSFVIRTHHQQSVRFAGAPSDGCRVMASMPLISSHASLSCCMIAKRLVKSFPFSACRDGHWRRPSTRATNSLTRGLSFMVQGPAMHPRSMALIHVESP